MSGHLSVLISPEWGAQFFPSADREEVTALIPDGHILGVRALDRRKWRVYLMTDELPTHKRQVVWTKDVRTTYGKDAVEVAFRLQAKEVGS